MKLSKQDFGQKIHSGGIVLSLIGMSNIGKSYWSEKLSDHGFLHINCDANIEEKLSSYLFASGYKGLEDMSAWMGQPFEEKYQNRQKLYLDSEMEVMEEILEILKFPTKQNIVIDTTGSLVHTSKEICTRLSEFTLMVYIKATDEEISALYDQYFKYPKPTIFGQFYREDKGTSRQDAMYESYKNLLNFRSNLYSEFADISISTKQLKGKSEAMDFLKLIQSTL